PTAEVRVGVGGGGLWRRGHAQHCRYRCRGVSRAEAVVLAFGTLSEPGQAAARPQCLYAIPAAGEDLVRVSLMANVPYQFVIGGVKDVMQCDRQFDHPEASSKVAARDRDRVDRLRAQFIGNLSKVPCIDTAQIVRAFYRVEDVGGWVCQELIFGRRHALTTFPLTRRRLCYWQNLSKYLLSPNMSSAGSATKSLS